MNYRMRNDEFIDLFLNKVGLPTVYRINQRSISETAGRLIYRNRLFKIKQ